MTIFHTNDFHNKLRPEQAARLGELKRSAEGSILLDSGDAIWAGNIFFRPGGERVLKLMNQAGYDAMAMGNREFHFLQTGLRRKIGWAKFPVLCANIRPIDNADMPVRADVTLERKDLKVVVFGLTVPMITERMLSRRVSAYVFDDPIETAAGIVPQLRKRADLLIALTHIGLNRDRELASAVPGIDLIVGGHTHAALERPETVGKTAIVQAGWFAHRVGRVEIEPGGDVRGELLKL
ncbi:MAG: metallophosphatase [Armatimonadetes bacterium]|nr:metallophosphatase [Armatimonadota bacterium]